LQLQCADRRLDLSRPAIMGILNITPDSFSDGGRFGDRGLALQHAHDMAAAGAAIIDVGGESTRPGALPVSLQEELDRVLPVIESLRRELDVLVSIDTMKPQVMRQAVAAGAGMINDVQALQAPGALDVAASSGAAVCLMHMQGQPQTMQAAPQYADVVTEVRSFLQVRADTCIAAGMAADRIVLDPGFGFGKSLEHNLQLLANLQQLAQAGYPLLVGLSRKSILARLTGRPVDDRLAGSLALAAIAVLHGARIVRCHDVAETRDAVRVAHAVLSGV
jgi:dihydropteroate synthase